MNIDRQKAIDMIQAGDARFAGVVNTDKYAVDNRQGWAINNLVEQRVDHVHLADDEPLVGCVSCGKIVEPEADPRGCGCHCPECQATL